MKPLNEAENTLSNLLNYMNGKSVTSEWGAVLAYNRKECNKLLLQEYLAKLDGDSFLPPISGVVGGDGRQQSDAGAGGYHPFTTDEVHISNAVLSTPYLTFETADFVEPKAKMTCDFISATVLEQSAPIGGATQISRVGHIVPLTAAHVYAHINLLTVNGDVEGETGAVKLSLAQPDDVDFTVDFVLAPIMQSLTGYFFKQEFDKAPDDQKTFTLGLIDPASNEVLTPGKFQLRTQVAPGGSEAEARAARGRGEALASNYGDGAVVVFVAMKGDAPGKMPDESLFPYLIPNDVDAQGRALYTATTIVQSHTFMNKIVKPSVISNLKLTEDVFYSGAGNPNLAYQLVGESGSISDEFRIALQHWGGGDAALMLYPDFKFQDALIVSPTGTVDLSFSNAESIFWWLEAPWDSDDDGYLKTQRVYSVSHSPTLDAEGKIKFVRGNDKFNLVIDWSTAPEAVNESGRVKIREHLDAMVSDFLFKTFEFPLSSVNTLLLDNLLFAQSNVNHLKAVYLPGDLVAFGEIDKNLTELSIEPLTSVLATGTSQTFTCSGSDAVTWSCRILDDEAASCDVSPAGLFTAPAIEGDFARVVITATAGLKTTSALAYIVAKRVAAYPSFELCRAAATAPVALKVGVAGAAATHTLVGPGTLVPDTAQADTYLFTPPAGPANGEKLALSVAQFTSGGDTAEVELLTVFENTSANIAYTVTSPSTATLSFKLGTAEIPAAEVQYEVLNGAGAIDGDGVFTRAQSGRSVVALIKGAYEAQLEVPPGSGNYIPMPFWGFTVLSLPL